MSETDAPDPGTAGFLPDGREGDVLRVWHTYPGMPNPVGAIWTVVHAGNAGPRWLYEVPTWDGGFPRWDVPGEALRVTGWRYLTRADDNPADVADAVGEGDVVDPASELREARDRLATGLVAAAVDVFDLHRIIGQIELALAGETPPPADSPDAWGPLAMRVAGLVAGPVAGDGGWDAGPLPAGEAEGDEIETEENMDDDDRGGRHFWNGGRWIPAYAALGWQAPGDPVVRWRWIIRNGEAVR